MKEQLQRPNATCAKCGRLFFCGKDSDDCWCDHLTLDARQQEALAGLRLEGCLCESCLDLL